MGANSGLLSTKPHPDILICSSIQGAYMICKLWPLSCLKKLCNLQKNHIEKFLPRIDNFSKQTQSDAKEKRVAANINVPLP